jgi:hypothetical protein
MRPRLKMGCNNCPPKLHRPAGPVNRLVSAELWKPPTAVSVICGK